MPEARPIYKKLLIITIVVYVIANAAMVSQLYHKIGEIEHQLVHVSGRAR
ncbi:MAG: hypothetical protein HQ579_08580 [Candidatus Omnitrophica bacterium]|nr:hypothetical protein [Candidatus Omnitrophota bacterium]